MTLKVASAGGNPRLLAGVNRPWLSLPFACDQYLLCFACDMIESLLFPRDVRLTADYGFAEHLFPLAYLVSKAVPFFL